VSKAESSRPISQFGRANTSSKEHPGYKNASHLFFKTERPTCTWADLPPGYHWTIWRPAFNQLMPSKVGHERKRFASRWAMHQLRLFSNRDYQVLVIRHRPGDEIVHYSGATGRYWRWPFMDPGDMQIGDTWTDPDHRGRGLARFALARLLHELTKPGRRIWYVVDHDNFASIKVARSCGMSLAGTGFITQPRYFSFLHAFVMEPAIGLESADAAVSPRPIDSAKPAGATPSPPGSPPHRDGLA
jgi:RimJ/RimL family protein N-acetyltransferase